MTNKRFNVFAIGLLLLALVGCARNQPSPTTPPTPTNTISKSIAILSDSTVAATLTTDSLYKQKKIDLADRHLLFSIYGQLDSVCYQSALILKSTNSNSVKYVELAALAASVTVPKFANPEAQAQVSVLIAGLANLSMSIEALRQ